MSGKSAKILVILGMHRSGTSLTAQWLNAAGLFLGDDVAGAGTGNVKGHYEDNDFMFLHDQILRANGLDYLVGTQSLKISTIQRDKANALIAIKSKANDAWGWKEPRTCLFVNEMYDTLLKEKYYLIVFRDYKEVVDSLYRRQLQILKAKVVFPRGYMEINRFKKNKSTFINQALTAWIRYNGELIQLMESTKAKFVCSDINSIPELSGKIMDYLVDDWQFPINKVPFSEVYEKSMLGAGEIQFDFDTALEQEAKAMMEKLHQFQLR